MSRTHSYVDCTELLHGYHDHDFEPYGTDMSVAAADYAELRLQPVTAGQPVKDQVIEAMVLAGLK